MKQKVATVLVIWVFALIGLVLTAESLDCTFFLFLTAFGFTSYALRYNSNVISHEA